MDEAVTSEEIALDEYRALHDEVVASDFESKWDVSGTSPVHVTNGDR